MGIGLGIAVCLGDGAVGAAVGVGFGIGFVGFGFGFGVGFGVGFALSSGILSIVYRGTAGDGVGLGIKGFVDGSM